MSPLAALTACPIARRAAAIAAVDPGRRRKPRRAQGREIVIEGGDVGPGRPDLAGQGVQVVLQAGLHVVVDVRLHVIIYVGLQVVTVASVRVRASRRGALRRGEVLVRLRYVAGQGAQVSAEAVRPFQAV